MTDIRIPPIKTNTADVRTPPPPVWRVESGTIEIEAFIPTGMPGFDKDYEIKVSVPRGDSTEIEHIVIEADWINGEYATWLKIQFTVSTPKKKTKRSCMRLHQPEPQGIVGHA